MKRIMMVDDEEDQTFGVKIARDAGDFLGEDYIEKPFEIDNVVERIDKILGR